MVSAELAPEYKVPWAARVAFYLCFAYCLPLAADKSGVSPSTISLPKGPGPSRGSASPSTSLNTGTAITASDSKCHGTAGHVRSLRIDL